ncbi:MAG: DUF2752 domain-containing protein [Deltaproteobacteria bacterium]|nr:DUF2752 domain-containing protein [Deltaproteobacteria bacterium]
MAGCAAAIAGSYALTVSENGDLRFCSTFSQSQTCIPEVCILRRIIGISCPGCGLMRSFAATARIELKRAVFFNPMGPVLFVICIFQIPYRMIKYYEVGSSQVLWNKIDERLDLVTWTIVGGLLLAWFARIVDGLAS